MIPIPANAKVVLVGGDIYEDAFVKIRYAGKILLMLSEDLRAGGEPGGTTGLVPQRTGFRKLRRSFL